MTAVFTCEKPLILASGSPRRQSYLRELGLEFTVISADIDESAHPSEAADDFVIRMAYAKADAVMSRFTDHWVLAADTIVSLDNEILGKPATVPEAKDMLEHLSSRTHTVWSGVCLGMREENIRKVISVQTQVVFAELSEEIIKSYVATGEPFDKAGGYGIQGQGAFLVTEITGSYSNVVGLPLSQTLKLLINHNIITTP